MSTPTYSLPSPEVFLKRLGEFRTERRLTALAELAGIRPNTLYQLAHRGKKPLLEHAHKLWPLMDKLDAADAAAAAAHRAILGDASPPPLSSHDSLVLSR